MLSFLSFPFVSLVSCCRRFQSSLMFYCATRVLRQDWASASYIICIIYVTLVFLSQPFLFRYLIPLFPFQSFLISYCITPVSVLGVREARISALVLLNSFLSQFAFITATLVFLSSHFSCPMYFPGSRWALENYLPARPCWWWQR